MDRMYLHWFIDRIVFLLESAFYFFGMASVVEKLVLILTVDFIDLICM